MARKRKKKGRRRPAAVPSGAGEKATPKQAAPAEQRPAARSPLARLLAGDNVERLLAFAGVVALVVVGYRSAWMCDDAYITLRTADNLVSGLGLTWNPAERVQTYTNPLWMLVFSLVYAITGEEFVTGIALALVITAAAAGLLVWRGARSGGLALLAVAGLCCSKAFVDYSTSGMENPLTHLLVVAFAVLLIRDIRRPWQLFSLALVAGLGAVNRLDAALLFAPGLLYAAWRVGWRRSPLPLLAGLAPLWIWLVFAVVYYGFPFPNTYYAKLGAGLDRGDLLAQGLKYLANSLRVDPVSTLCVAGAVAAAAIRRSGRAITLVVGALVYLAYVAWVGGDFMSGRFISAPLCLALSSLAVSGLALRRWQLGLALAAVIGVGAYPITSPLRAGDDYGIVARVKARDGVEDERRFYHKCASLALATDEGWPACVHAREGRRDRDRGEAVLVKGSVGYYGFFAGPDKHVVDRFALVDPLLARLPMERYKWRIGHFRRRVPPGYLDTLRGGENRIADTSLARYYDRLALVVRGDLFSAERFAAIWELNTGGLDHLIREEMYR